MAAELILVEKYKETIEMLKELVETQKQITQVYKEHSQHLQEQLDKSVIMIDELLRINKQLVK